VLNHTGDLARTFGLNYPEFPDSCRRIPFAFFINMDEMLVDGFDRYLIQLGHQPLGEPDGCSVDAHPHAQRAVLTPE